MFFYMLRITKCNKTKLIKQIDILKFLMQKKMSLHALL